MDFVSKYHLLDICIQSLLRLQLFLDNDVIPGAILIFIDYSKSKGRLLFTIDKK